jgi:hypothetical protein
MTFNVPCGIKLMNVFNTIHSFIHSFISRMMILSSGSMLLLECNIWMLMAILCNTQFHFWYLVYVMWSITLNENYEFFMTYLISIPIKSINIVAIWPQFHINPFNPFLSLVKIPYVEKSIADLATKMRKMKKIQWQWTQFPFCNSTLNFT